LDLLDPLRRMLDLDRLNVGAGEDGGILSGGTRLADDLRLDVSTSATSLAQASIEWEIRPRLELVSRFGFGRDSSVALRWRREY